jgi:V-type H+-transporting ATPase subunit d
MEKYPPYQSIFAKLSYGESQMLDKAFYEEEVKRLCLSFEQQVIFFFKILISFALIKCTPYLTCTFWKLKP